MASTEPLVTLGVPVYNGERYLRQAMDGILAQTFDRWCVLLSDNASTDSTPSICAEYCRRDSRVTYVRHPVNRGAGWNFNEVFRRALTPYFVWHAADDLIHPEYLQECMRLLAEHPEAVLGYTEADIMDSTGRLLPHVPEPRPLDSPDVVVRFRACLSPFPYCENATYGVMRSTAVARTGLQGEFGGGDRAFLAALSLEGTFVRSPRILSCRRTNEDIRTEQQRQHYSSGEWRTLNLREWRILVCNLAAIWRSGVSLATKPALYASLLDRLVRRWRTYVRELLSLRNLFSSSRAVDQGSNV